MPELRLTNTSIAKIKPPEPKLKNGKSITAQMIYRDTEVKGFALRVTSGGAKTFIAEKWVEGKLARVSIADASQLTAEAARDEARKIIGQVITSKVNPNEQKRIRKAKSVTLQQAFDDFLQARKNLAPRTISDYRYITASYFPDWLNKPLTAITPDMIARRHTRLGERSKSQSNYAMRMLRALFNFAIAKYEVAGEQAIAVNPVKRLSQTKAWFRDSRKQSYINQSQLKAWFAGVEKLDSASSADYLRLLMLTGMRKTEGASLLWEDVNLDHRTFTIRDTKNHDDHTLPMTDYLYDLFRRRALERRNAYVFPGAGENKDSYLKVPTKAVQAVIAASGVQFSPHDLRRTFISIAESLDISAYAVKRLVNHKMRNDVTAGYIVTDVERLRKPMQQITDYILGHAGIKKSASVRQLEKRVAAS